jgi:hypothetical protein
MTLGGKIIYFSWLNLLHNAYQTAGIGHAICRTNLRPFACGSWHR